jgi:outer membrane protein TolC
MISVLAVVLAAPLPCGPLDLPSALSLVSVRSDEVAIKQAAIAGAEADRALARALGIFPVATATLMVGPVPEAHGTITESKNSNRSLDGLGPFVRVDVNVVQPLWTWGQISAAKRAAQAGLEARQLLVQDTLQQVQLRVIQSYWGISLATKLLSLAEQVKDALIQVDKKIDEALAKQSGEITQEDRYRVAIFRSEVSQKTSEAEKGLRLARVALAAMLGIDETELQLKGEALPTLAALRLPSREEAIAKAAQSRPDLRALDKALLALQSQVDASHGAQFPQLFASGLFTYAYAPNRDIQHNPWIRDDFNVLAAGVAIGLRQNLAFPLLRAQAQKAEAELGATRRQREGLARLVQVQVDQALADLKAAEEKDVAAQAALSAGKSWFRSAGLNFQAGVSDARALLDGYSGYVKSQMDHAQATYELLLARGHLDQVTGQPLLKGESTCVVR